MAIDTDAIRDGADLVAVAGHYTALHKRGSEYVGLCPFHEDSDPSFYVVPDKKFCHCFVCGETRDVIQLVMDAENLDFNAACERLGANKWEPKLDSPAPTRKRIETPPRITRKPPEGTSPPKFGTKQLGEPVVVFPINDLDGSALGWECRYEVEGKKQPRIWSWGAKEGEEPRWAMGHFNEPRPFYGMDRLTARPKAPVLITEGPKKADAGRVLLPMYASVSWTGGANAVLKHNWEPLRGRQVLVWPDNDGPGLKAATLLAEVLSDPAGLACQVKIIDPNRQPESWDCADAVEEGWTTEQAIAWAKPRVSVFPAPVEFVEPPPAAEAPPPVGQIEKLPAKPRRPRSAKPQLASVDGNTVRQPDPDPEELPEAFSDDHLADAFAERHSETWKYVKAWGKWLEFVGDGWRVDENEYCMAVARSITRSALYWDGAAHLPPASRKKLNSVATASNLLRFARCDRRIFTPAEQWDADNYLLGVPGGVVDLRTGELHPARREDYITQRCAVAPEDGEPTVWLEYLRKSHAGNQEMIDFLQRFGGYALTGDVNEHALVFLYGSGRNGKGVFIDTLVHIMGDYALAAPISVFAESKSERHSTELAQLRGKRFVSAEEPSGGMRWDEGRIKWLTGGGTITARFMRMDDFSFQPNFKLMFAGNHKPALKTIDPAIKARFNIVPFTVEIPAEERDLHLREKLKSEAGKILNWLIQGCIAWQKSGLKPPADSIAATDQYLQAEDIIGQWIDECCDREGTCDGSMMYKNYQRWCERQGETAWSRRAWSNNVTDRGFSLIREGGARLISGLSIKGGMIEEPPTHQNSRWDRYD